jgi:hypothetical protein
MALSIYPWDILTEIGKRLESPSHAAGRAEWQVKLLNAPSRRPTCGRTR